MRVVYVCRGRGGGFARRGTRSGPAILWTRDTNASEASPICVPSSSVHADLGTCGLDRTRWRRTHRRSCKSPALMYAPACQRCEKPCQSPAGCAPETGSVAGYRMEPASGESCDVLLLLLRISEPAAVGLGISLREGGASSRLRRAAFSSCRLLAMRSQSSACASLPAKESAHSASDR